MSLLSVKKATEIISENNWTPDTQFVDFQQSVGFTLAENIWADRDFPPFDRVTMDGYALCRKAYEAHQRMFKIADIQFAGQAPKVLSDQTECIEVMTGSVLPTGTDTVVRYEDTRKEGEHLVLVDGLAMGRNIHRKGTDKRAGDILLSENHLLRSPDLAVLATVGKLQVQVFSKPKVAVITSGDELVAESQIPLPHQIRKSNAFVISELIKPFCEQIKHFHLPDKLPESIESLRELLQKFDVLILSGGVSEGQKDYIPTALEKIGVEMLLYKIAQRPGKPMWFGRKEQRFVFALPGNPVSAFLCTLRYIKPWFQLDAAPEESAILTQDVLFKPALTYFLQVKLGFKDGKIFAQPQEGHGSGDLANLSYTDAFMELPQQESELYKKGSAYRIWRF